MGGVKVGQKPNNKFIILEIFKFPLKRFGQTLDNENSPGWLHLLNKEQGRNQGEWGGNIRGTNFKHLCW